MKETVYYYHTYFTKDSAQPIKITKAEILKEYFSYWLVQFKKINKTYTNIPHLMAAEKNCINDWVRIHKAYKG